MNGMISQKSNAVRRHITESPARCRRALGSFELKLTNAFGTHNGIIAIFIAFALTACGSNNAVTSSTPWCVSNLTPGEHIRMSPDICSSIRSVSPPLSSMPPSDFCVECTPRCGAIKYPFNGDEYYTDADLPAGACANEGEKCDMDATAPLFSCNGIVHGCALNTYRCTCANGKWSCGMTSQGAGACGRCEDSGITDAGGD
jgi:hypothetical protein